jgi:WD40 repeat protein
MRGGVAKAAALVAAWLLGGGPVSLAEGQASLRNQTQPILVYQTKGHAGTISSILFDPATGDMLTAGYDKVVNVWRPRADRLELTATIRPPIWRAQRGSLFAMDLSPARNAVGEAILAVAGQGLQANNGDIGLFSYPGRANPDTGDQIRRLNGRNTAAPEMGGHNGTVEALKFHPAGSYLASGGGDGIVHLWNPADGSPISILPAVEAGASVDDLAFDRAGRRLWVALSTGRIVLWDVANPRAPRFVADSGEKLRVGGNRDVPGDLEINGMVPTPDESRLIVGFEDGRLLSIGTADLDGVQKLPLSGTRGPIEAIAIAPDGTIAVSVIEQAYRTAGNQEPPRAECLIELRDSATGDVTRTVHRGRHRLLALAFSPDGRSLAFGGDSAQSVFLHRLGEDRAPLEARGQGSTLWDVGFTRDGKTLALSRTRPGDPAPPLTQAFDLENRRPTLVPRSEVVNQIRTVGKWTIRAVDLLQLEVTDGISRFPVILPDESTRWWDFSFVPELGRPEDDPPLVVVGCASGDGLVFAANRLDPAQAAFVYASTHKLEGHSAAVTCVAPSPDGRWVATGSDDQTARLWLTRGWRTVPPLGIRAVEEGGRFVVAEVAPRSFGEFMGLEKGDVLISWRVALPGVAGYDGVTPIPVNPEMISFWDRVPSGSPMRIKVSRAGAEREFLTSRSDNAVLSLFIGENLEWVVWTPEAYYDTSIDGDRSFLGFHTNGSDLAGGFKMDEDTDFFTIDRFENELRKPKLLDALWSTGDAVAAYAGLAKLDVTTFVQENKPPEVQLALKGVAGDRGPTGSVVVDAPELDVDVVVRTKGFSGPVKGLRRIQVLRDSGEAASTEFPEPAPPIAPNAEQRFPFRVRLTPGLQQVSALVSNGDREVPRTAVIPIEYRPKIAPPPPMRPSSLHVIAFGTDGYGSDRLSPIPKAVVDLEELGRFFSDPKVHGYREATVGARMIGESASLSSLISQLETLESERAGGKLGPGDTVVIAIETHLIAIDETRSGLATRDASEKDWTGTTIPTSLLTDRLGKLAKSGCRVILLLDVQHANRYRPPAGVRSGDALKAWARALKSQRVSVGIASTTGPATIDNTSPNGVFTRAILGSVDRRNWKRRASVDEPMTLGDFKDTVEALVAYYTKSSQVGRFYEANVPLGSPFLIPPSPGLPVAVHPR